MPAYDFRSPRLYVDAALGRGATVELAAGQAHYLTHVLRLKGGERVLVFNGRDGEWSAGIARGKRATTLEISDQTRAQTTPGDLHYVFAPLKTARLDYMVQKAVEMGASRLQPVLTRFGQVSRVNAGRMGKNAIEAAEQCGILNLPEVEAPLPLPRYLAGRERARFLIFCDETAGVADPAAALGKVPPRAPLAVLVGPEGGFAEEERAALLRAPQTLAIALGPRILRADTAAVAALALVQTVLGDWR